MTNPEHIQRLLTAIDRNLVAAHRLQNGVISGAEFDATTLEVLDARAKFPSSLTPETTVLHWRQCVCDAWYWGAEQTDSDRAHSKESQP